MPMSAFVPKECAIMSVVLYGRDMCLVLVENESACRYVKVTNKTNGQMDK